jgi:hypothetical protein
MDGVYKPYDPEKEKWDARGKAVAAKNLTAENSCLIHSPIVEDFGVDIKTQISAGLSMILMPALHEVEVNLKWEQGSFPDHWTVNYPERKDHLLHEFHFFFYWRIRKDLARAVILKSPAIRHFVGTQGYEELPNCEAKRGELFCRVPRKYSWEIELTPPTEQDYRKWGLYEKAEAAEII